MLMAVAEIGFARKENTIMTQVWGSSSPQSRLPSFPAADSNITAAAHNLMNFCPFNAISPSYSPSLCVKASSVYVCTL